MNKSIHKRASFAFNFFIALSLALFALSCKSSEGPLPIKKISGLNPLTSLFNPPLPVKPFSLTDHRGNIFTEKDLQKKWSFIFFGYTHCPDVCPSTLNKMASIFSALEKNGDINTSFIFVSVDPKRDDAETLAKYVSYFNDSFLGLTGKEAEIKEFTRQVGTFYMISEETDGKTENDYQMDHSASILLFDPLGRQVARFSAIQKADSILADFRKIRDANVAN